MWLLTACLGMAMLISLTIQVKGGFLGSLRCYVVNWAFSSRTRRLARSCKGITGMLNSLNPELEIRGTASVEAGYEHTRSVHTMLVKTLLEELAGMKGLTRNQRLITRAIFSNCVIQNAPMVTNLAEHRDLLTYWIFLRILIDYTTKDRQVPPPAQYIRKDLGPPRTQEEAPVVVEVPVVVNTPAPVEAPAPVNAQAPEAKKEKNGSWSIF
jgi:hypothetical protein